MASKKRGKAQASLEYLITYGWALVAIATIVGVLIFASGGGINANTCTTFLTLLCKGIAAEGDQLILVLQNAAGQKITINPFTDIGFDGRYGYAIIVYGDQEYRFGNVEIGAGEEFRIEAYGQVLSDEITITYRERATGLTRTVTSSMGTDAPPNTELSNDGLPQTPGGLIDCQDAAVGPCEYPVEVTGPAGEEATDFIVSAAGGTNIAFNSDAVANLIGSGVDWDVTGVYIYFYVPIDPGTNVYATMGDIQSTEEITQGWNSVAVEDFITPTLLEAGIVTLSGDFSIKAANSESPPKMVIVVEEREMMRP